MDERRKIPNYRKYIINEIPENFEENRKKGENEEYICQIIRNDSIEDFITYVNKHFISINSTISKSIYETNNFLLKINKQTTNKEITLIEYSAFYRSVQIFKYLQLNKAEFNSNLWLFAIHGNHPEIISILENNQIKPNTYKDCFKEAIKCHFNSIADYIYNNHIKNEELHEFAKFFLKSFNFYFIKKEYCEPILFYYLCKYDYSSIVAFLLENKNIDVNQYHIKREKKSNKICPFYQYEGTSFHQAVVKNNFATVKLLLKNDKVDVNLPLIIKSYENESYENENENDEDFDECMKVKEVTPLISAIKQENIEMVRLLLSCENVKVNYYIESKFTNGKCKFDDVDNDNWRSLNVNGEWKKKSALIVAVLKGNVEIVHLLLENKRINPNSLYEEIDMRGIECSTDYFHKNEKTPLNIAVSNRNIEIVKLLLNHEKIDPNICSIKEKDWESFVKEMSESSDDVIPEIGRFDDRCELILSKYKTALNLAIKNCGLNMVKILLENKKVDINKINYSYLNETIEKTALLYAIEKNQIDIVKLLLEQEKIDLNIECAISDEEKTTALLYAIDKKNVDIVKLLLEQKNLGLDDKMKEEAREYALQTDNQEIINLFKEEEKK